ncbi:MarR family transcriptional regulator [Aliishimia ponticola]|uniref:MarR family transcriptional regulator n=1 Tax=Aliishimia ponticola TaxID=2499833 RepID=A0A4S4NCA6_9RHOB|nr:MarR family transcriptional regulator [Aliishimia ponticola]THH36097.1 MarR family transcriptional regulator [Aliishimia ponticola]
MSGFPADLPPELKVLMGVYYLYWKVDELIAASDKKHVLAKNELQMLISLEQSKRMGEIAENMQVLPSTVTNIADTLESQGFITRQRDPDDRRAWRLSLTDEGRQLRAEYIDYVSTLFHDVSGLSQAETKTIADLMLKVASHIKAGGLPEGVIECL